MTKRFPIRPPHPERNCWGCDKYCSATSMACGNGSDRTQHPVELFGEDWVEWQDGALEGEAMAPTAITQGSANATGRSGGTLVVERS